MFESSFQILFFGLFLAILIITANAEDSRVHKKRQIYREQVLPHAGGRIPDTAFETDRLFLNRLQKEGIAVPDGVVLEQRNPQVYPFESKNTRKVFRIALSTDDDRFTSKEGRFLNENLQTIETTYLYPQIHGHKSTKTLPTTLPAYPIYRQLQVHNQNLNQLKFQTKKKDYDVTTTAVKGPVKEYKTTSYQNVNLISLPTHYKPKTATATSAIAAEAEAATSPRLSGNSFRAYFGSDERQFLPSYEPRGFFNAFDDFFAPIEFYDSSSLDDPYFYKVTSVDLPATGFGTPQEQFLF